MKKIAYFCLATSIAVYALTRIPSVTTIRKTTTIRIMSAEEAVKTLDGARQTVIGEIRLNGEPAKITYDFRVNSYSLPVTSTAFPRSSETLEDSLNH